MLSLPSKKHLCDLLVGIASGERRLEICRQVLCELPSFEPYTCFLRLDRNQQQYLTSYDLAIFFH